jgi:hypothetical protein
MGEGAETVSMEWPSGAGPTRSWGAPLGREQSAITAYSTRGVGKTARPTSRSGGRPVQDSGERSGREAGVRYSVHRAQRGRGRFPPLYSPQLVDRGWHRHERERAPAALADGREAKKLRPFLSRPQDTQTQPPNHQPQSLPTQQQKNTQNTLPVAAGIAARPERKRLKIRCNSAPPYAYALCRR